MSASSSPSTRTARSIRSRATPRTGSRVAPTGPTAAAPPATSAWGKAPLAATDYWVVDASIVVVVQGDLAEATRCLEALAALPPDPGFEVIAVDDASGRLDDLLACLEGDV